MCTVERSRVQRSQYSLTVFLVVHLILPKRETFMIRSEFNAYFFRSTPSITLASYRYYLEVMRGSVGKTPYSHSKLLRSKKFDFKEYQHLRDR